MRILLLLAALAVAGCSAAISPGNVDAKKFYETLDRHSGGSAGSGE